MSHMSVHGDMRIACFFPAMFTVSAQGALWEVWFAAGQRAI
jgi:hypothetical protein